MTFLQSIFLTGLTAVSIPLIIHFFSRRKRERIAFGSLYFLKLIETKKIRRIKLKQILLLLIRMAVISLLVFAFARPTLTGDTSKDGYGVSDDTRISAVIIVDNSVSEALEIDGTQVYERTRQKALRSLESLKEGDEIYLLFAADTQDTGFNPLPERDLESIRRQIQQSRISFRKVDLTNVLKTAYSLLGPSTNLHREIFLVSDMQAAGFGSGNFSQKILPDVEEDNNGISPVRLFFIDASPQDISPNAGIVSVAIQNQIIELGKQLTLRATIQNYGDVPVRDLLVYVYFNGQRLAQKNITLESFGSEVLNFQIIPEQPGIIEGMIEIEDDEFAVDNRRFFVINIPDKRSVLIINSNDEANIFLQAVFSPELSPRVLDVQTISEEQISSADFRQFDVVIYNGFTQMTQADIFRMRNFCAAGGGVIIFPDENSNLVSLNETIGEDFSLPVASGFSGDLVRQMGLQGFEPDSRGTGNSETDFLTVDAIDFSHPVFVNMFKQIPPEDISLPRIFKSVNFDLRSAGENSSKSIITMSNSKPFLTETPVDRGAIVLFASAPSLSWTTLPLKGIFSPLLHRLVFYLSQYGSVAIEPLEIGDEISLLFAGAADELTIDTPLGDRIKLSPSVASEAYRVDYSNTESPGIYKFKSGNEVQNKFAVNVNSQESDFRKVSMEKLDSMFGGRQYYYWEESDNISERINEIRTGREISRYFIIGVLIFLLLETIIQHEKTEPETE